MDEHGAYDSLKDPPDRLQWLQSTPSLFELRAGHRHFGDLRFDAPLAERAIGTVANGQWRFLHGILRRRIRILEASTLHEVGVMRLTGRNSGVLFDPQTNARLSELSWLHTARAWSSTDDWLIRFQPGGESSADLFKFQYNVELDESARDLQELPLLLLLGWYALSTSRR